jgi:hypothetical protein
MLKAVVNTPVRSGDQTINNGNLIVGTAGKGIDFSANANAAGMTGELLTWYEEGTWDAVLSDGTNNATMTRTTCRYTRIGRMVFVGGWISTSSKGSISGSLRLTGLPFTVANANAAYGSGSVGYAAGLNLTAGWSVTLLPEINTNYIALFLWSLASGTAPLGDGQWNNNGQIIFTANYSV